MRWPFASEVELVAALRLQSSAESLEARRAAREAAPELFEIGERAGRLPQIFLVDATDLKQRSLSPQPATGGLRAQAGQRGRPGSIGSGRGAFRRRARRLRGPGRR